MESDASSPDLRSLTQDTSISGVIVFGGAVLVRSSRSATWLTLFHTGSPEMAIDGHLGIDDHLQLERTDEERSPIGKLILRTASSTSSSMTMGRQRRAMGAVAGVQRCVSRRRTRIHECERSS
jgi:hypothetical protein